MRRVDSLLNAGERENGYVACILLTQEEVDAIKDLIDNEVSTGDSSDALTYTCSNMQGQI